MNHLPYEEWLLSDEPLNPEQKAELRDHLETCESCRQIANAWQSVASAIQSTPEVAPAPGFTVRWQTRRAERRAALQRRNTWIILSICIVGALVTLVALALPQVGGLPSPIQLLSSLMQSASMLLATLSDIQDVLGAILSGIPLGVPLLLWIVVTMTLAFWSIVWVVFVWRLPKLRRSQNEA